MKKVVTEIGKESIVITVSSEVHGSVVIELPYTMVNPRAAVQIAGILASDPCVQPSTCDDTQKD